MGLRVAVRSLSSLAVQGLCLQVTSSRSCEIFFSSVFHIIMPKKSGDVRRSASLNESELRMKLLESEVLRLRQAAELGKKRSRRERSACASSSEESSASDLSSSGSSSSGSSRASSSDLSRSSSNSPSPVRKSKGKKSKSSSKKVKKVKRKSVKVSTSNSSKWASKGYEHQYTVMARIKRLAKSGSGHARAGRTKEARKCLDHVARIAQTRLEWLAIANRHGTATANSYEEGDELEQLVASASKKKRLRAAIETTKTSLPRRSRSASVSLPFRASTPARTSDWGAHVKTNTGGGAQQQQQEQQRQTASPGQQQANGPVTRQMSGCHHCGQIGHYVRYCPKLQQK